MRGSELRIKTAGRVLRVSLCLPACVPLLKVQSRCKPTASRRSEEHTSELQSPCNLVCRLLLEKKKTPRARACARSPPVAVHETRSLATTATQAGRFPHRGLCGRWPALCG